MAKIAIERAPPTGLPRRFLLASPAWGAAAGVLLLLDGPQALGTRWAPATLALVHALTLGAWGNAMFGSLLQFLPAAAGVRVRGGLRAGGVLHVTLNAGALLLVAGLHALAPGALALAGVLLAVAFTLLVAMLAPGLLQRLREAGPRALPAGVLLALGSALVTAALGLAMLSALTGHRGLPALPWIDVHAAWGVLGWMLGLLAAVGSVAMPMFQGTPAPSARLQWAWFAATLVVLVGGGCLLGVHGVGAVLRLGVAACLAALGGAGLLGQWRARHARNAWLVRSWRAGFLALLAAATVLALQGPALLAGGLVLGVALPFLVGGMQLEIMAFLGWIELTRRCPRGVRLPAIGRLLPDGEKAGVFAAQLAAAVLLLVALCWPPAARAAGVALVGSNTLLLWRLLGVQRRVRAFVAGRAPRPGDACAEPG